MSGNYLTKELREAILKTVVFFDLFNYPLTRWEIWQNLPIKIDLSDLEIALDNFLQQENILEVWDGFYFLAGRNELIKIRRERYNYANSKIKIARRASWFFRLLPSVKMVAVSNLIGHHNLRDESDVDILIISSPRRVWLSRLYCTGLMKLANQRPRQGNKRNKICLSFYASVDGLNMENLRLDVHDPYFDHWFLGLYPVYDQENILSYLHFKNVWLKEVFPNSLLLKDSFPDNYFKRSFGEWLFFGLGDVLDFISKKIQMLIMPKRMKELALKEAGVLLSDTILRFYLNDRREEFYKKYHDRLIKLDIYE